MLWETLEGSYDIFTDDKMITICFFLFSLIVAVHCTFSSEVKGSVRTLCLISKACCSYSPQWKCFWKALFHRPGIINWVKVWVDLQIESKGYRTPSYSPSVMSLMISFVRSINIPLFFVPLFLILAVQLISMSFYFSQPLRDCMSQTTSEWMRSCSAPCTWQWIYLKGVTWRGPFGRLEHGANLLPGEESHMTLALSVGKWGWGGTQVR